jgi:hypothetical protein
LRESQKLEIIEEAIDLHKDDILNCIKEMPTQLSLIGGMFSDLLLEAPTTADEVTVSGQDIFEPGYYI